MTSSLCTACRPCDSLHMRDRFGCMGGPRACDFCKQLRRRSCRCTPRSDCIVTKHPTRLAAMSPLLRWGEGCQATYPLLRMIVCVAVVNEHRAPKVMTNHDNGTFRGILCLNLLSSTAAAFKFLEGPGNLEKKTGKIGFVK